MYSSFADGNHAKVIWLLIKLCWEFWTHTNRNLYELFEQYKDIPLNLYLYYLIVTQTHTKVNMQTIISARSGD